MAGTCKENGRGRDAKKDDRRKTVYRKKKKKTSFEMDGRCGSRPESDEDKAVDGEDAREKWRRTVEEAKAHPGL